MNNRRYYKSLAEIMSDWNKKNAFLSLGMTNMAKSVLLRNRMITELEKSTASFRVLQEQIRDLNASLYPMRPVFEQSLLAANLKMSVVMNSVKPQQGFFERLQKDQDKFFESLKELRFDFSKMMNSSILAHKSLAHINFSSIGNAFNVTQRLRNSLQESLIEIANSYQYLWSSFSTNPKRILSSPKVVMREPSTEMYVATHQAFISTKEVEVTPEEEIFLSEIKPSEVYIHGLIASIDADLLTLYNGVKDAIQSNNSDKIRHVSISIRELLTQIIHKLAPDNAFFEWNQDSSNVSNARPTRKGRLRYICKNINYGEFTDFVEKDISTATAFFDLLQKGTHNIKKPYNDQQLRALLLRLNCLISFIISISREV